MSNFNNKTITSRGLELLSSALAGNILEFTRIVMGSGTYEGDIGLIESLVNQKQSLDIKSITRKGSQVVLSTTLLQSAIVEDFYWKEIGVYAKGSDGLEILYMYGSANEASYISKNMLNEKMINIGVLVSNATNITATINNSLVYLNQNDLEEHNNDEEAHTPIRTWVQGLFNSLKLTWDNIIGKPSTFPPSSHSHTKSQITDFPTSLPASDVYAWAKAPTKPTYTYTEVGALASNGKAVSSATADSATYAGGLHIYNEITGLKSTVVDGKQSVANAINGHLGTTLSNQTPFADLAYYITNFLQKIERYYSLSTTVQKIINSNYVSSFNTQSARRFCIMSFTAEYSGRFYLHITASNMSGFYIYRNALNHEAFTPLNLYSVEPTLAATVSKETLSALNNINNQYVPISVIKGDKILLMGGENISTNYGYPYYIDKLNMCYDLV